MWNIINILLNLRHIVNDVKVMYLAFVLLIIDAYYNGKLIRNEYYTKTL